MSKPYKEMDLDDLKFEKMRLEYWLNHTDGNINAYKQNKKSLQHIEQLIIRKIKDGIK